jgi:AraC-like DNA-binding protein
MPSRSAADPQAAFAAFLQTLASPMPMIELFDHLPHVQLFIKDAGSRFVRVNSTSLAMHGCRSMAEIVGRTDFDFHPPALASQYVEEDGRVMRTGKPLVDQVWLVMSHDGMPRWYLCTKLPLRGRDGRPAGIAGVMRLYDHTGPSPRDYHRLTPVMEFVLARYSERIEVAQLAAAGNLSVSQLQREFRRLFAMSPGEYLLKVRLLVARRRLEETNDPVGAIALDCGFYDQSHFTRAFTHAHGIAPLAYRTRFMRQSGVERMRAAMRR